MCPRVEHVEAMQIDQAAAVLAQLGHPVRLQIVRLLIRAGDGGVSVGGIQEHLDAPASTVAFHLRGLVSAGLVDQLKDGRSVLCTPRFDTLNAITTFLRAECCTGLPALPSDDAGAGRVKAA
jgi:ArsR family transcriptional regulator